MYNRLKRLYSEGRIDELGLSRAVSKGWISEEQKVEIINSLVDAQMVTLLNLEV